MVSDPRPASAAHASGETSDPFRLLVECVSDYAIFMLDPHGVVVSWNKGAERIKGYTSEEIVGRHFSTFYRADDAWKCEHLLAAALRDGRVEDEGYRVRKDGSVFWADVVITAIRDASGAHVGFAKVTRDLTERRRSMELLRESEERFRLLVESVKDYAIFMLDPRGVVMTWNVGAERIKGYRADEIIGEHFSKFYPREDVLAGKCEMELEGATRDGRFEDEGFRIRKDGTRFWANVVITAVRDAEGVLVGFAKVTRDLTERRRAEEERLRVGKLAAERIGALAELAEALASALSTADVTAAVMGRGLVFAQADTATLHLLDKRTKILELVAQRGCHSDLVEHIRQIGPKSDNPTYRVGAEDADAVWIEDEASYRALVPSVAALEVQGPRARAFWCVPLVAEGERIGMLGVGFYAPRRFDDAEREFIRTFARQSAQAFARAKRVEAERVAAALAERLRASLATTLRSIGDAVIATDAHGRIVLMNGVAESLVGWPEAEAIGQPLHEVFHIINEHTRLEVESPVARVLETGGIVGLANHTVLIARDGRELPIDDSGAPIRPPGGDIEGVVLVFRDVSERKREEARRAFLADATGVLAESLDYEETVSRVADLAVPRLADWCAVDLVVEDSARPKRLAVAHVDPSKIALAKELDERYPPRPNAPTGVPNVLRTGRSELYAEIPDELLVAGSEDDEHLRIARALALHSAMIVPLDVRGRIIGALTFVYAESGRRYNQADLASAEELARRCAHAIDNAKLYLSEQQARRNADVANRAKDEFLAVVSHELRTPLNAIMGWARMLPALDFDERRRQKAIRTIERNAIAMAQLIEDLLDMSRVTSGKLRLETQQVDVARVIEAAIESVRPSAAARRVEFASSIQPELPVIVGDATRLQQVIWNLLSNAVKFSSEGGRVDVAARMVGSEVEVQVADRGRGISPSFLPKVFEAFRQEDASSSRSHGGLGLGLAITKQIVELHRGRVTAASEGEGHGATFTVTLPASAPGELAAGSQGTRWRSAKEGAFECPLQLRGLRVLVVEDDDDARTLVTTILTDCGCDVRGATTVRTAIESVAKELPDVLLSDIGLPGEDGYDLIRQIRSLPREQGGEVPAAALTAFARPEDRRRLLNAGFSIHLPKPIEPAELIAVVATLSRFIARRNEAPT